MKKFSPLSKNFPHFLIGGDYSPEQWVTEEGVLDRDMELLREGNCNELTMGIFAWDTIEPTEGVFDFSLLDERMDTIYKNGGRVILATPTAAHPRWMNEKYPEIMLTQAIGVRRHFGSRVLQCLRSPIFKEKCRIINEKLAERYGNHPALIGWHLNNEYRAHDCFCPQCRREFIEWVRNKYGNDLDRLNHEWWTPFWSHRYQSFEQIEPPNPQIGETSVTGLSLDWRRFVSESVIDFVKMESDCIRKYSNAPITTNCMGTFDRYDHFKMAKHLDFYSNDTYPTWFNGKSVDENCAKHARGASLCRNMMGGKPYILMESAPGINVWRQHVRVNKSTEQQLFEAMFFVATGSDSVMYFQWRKGRGGGEKYHGAIVDHLGTSEHRVFKAVQTIGAMLKKMDGIVGTGIDAKVAVTHDYETMWALSGSIEEFEKLGGRTNNGYTDTGLALFNAFWKQNIPADMISYETDFSKYKIVFMPSPYLMTEALAEKMKAYVREGGTLVSFYMTAMTNENDLAYVGGMPGCGLRELFGLRVDEVGSYSSKECALSNSVSYNGSSYPVNANADVPILEGAEKLGEYERDYFKGDSAISRHCYGKGVAYHVAFCPDQRFADDFTKDLFRELTITAPSAVTGDEFIRVICREGDGEKYYFVLNCSEQEQSYTAHEELYDLLGEGKVVGTHTLPALGFAVLKGV